MTLEEWDIEDEQFYANEGKQIATRNLWASIPNLLLGFAVGARVLWALVLSRCRAPVC